jgi:Fe-S cluster assembly iron-binding protein IscA
MKRLIFILIILVINSLQFSCSEDNQEPVSAFCDDLVIIDNNMFQNRTDDDGTGRNAFEIVNVEIEEDCLLISIRSGGCNGDNWEIDLVDADRISETATPQRDLKIFFINNELCNAITGTTISFELTQLRTTGNVILLNLEKWDRQIEYRY